MRARPGLLARTTRGSPGGHLRRVELFEGPNRGREEHPEALPRRRPHVRGRTRETMKDRIAHGLVGARQGRVELAEPERMIENDRFEHGRVRVRGALVGEERAPRFGLQAGLGQGAFRIGADARAGRGGVRSCDPCHGLLGYELVRREAEELFDAAVTLPPDERAELVMRLLDSIAAPDDDLAAAQASESRARLDAARDGAIDLIDDDDAMRMIMG